MNAMNNLFGNFDPSIMLNTLFRKVDNAVWDLQTGRLGFVSKEGIHTLAGTGEDAHVELNIIQQFGMPIPAFARSTPLASVKVGDMISGTVKGWVIGIIHDKANPDTVVKFEILKLNGETTKWAPPQIKTLGFDSGVMIVTSLINLAPGGSAGMAGLQNSLMPLLMMSGGDLDLESLMPMLLMSGGFGTSTDASATNGLGNVIQTFMMMKMMGGMFGKNGKAGNMFSRPSMFDGHRGD